MLIGGCDPVGREDFGDLLEGLFRLAVGGAVEFECPSKLPMFGQGCLVAIGQPPQVLLGVLAVAVADPAEGNLGELHHGRTRRPGGNDYSLPLGDPRLVAALDLLLGDPCKFLCTGSDLAAAAMAA